MKVVCDGVGVYYNRPPTELNSHQSDDQASSQRDRARNLFSRILRAPTNYTEHCWLDVDKAWQKVTLKRKSKLASLLFQRRRWTSWVWCSNSEQVALKSIGCATITCRSVPTFQDLLVPLLQEMASNGAASNWFSEVRCHHRPSFYEASFLPTGLKIRHLAQEEVTVTVWPCSIFTQARITVSKHVVVSF